MNVWLHLNVLSFNNLLICRELENIVDTHLLNSSIRTLLKLSLKLWITIWCSKKFYKVFLLISGLQWYWIFCLITSIHGTITVGSTSIAKNERHIRILNWVHEVYMVTSWISFSFVELFSGNLFKIPKVYRLMTNLIVGLWFFTHSISILFLWKYSESLISWFLEERQCKFFQGCTRRWRARI